ncbi:MAG TPA: PEGA domain-containing protein, partial [Planctomycetes bacterium]|nr:PEGA domain-containing protein [Planctomycetota bacterium]
MRTPLVVLSCLVFICLDCETGVAKVRRRLTITSNPPGAVVFVDDREIGITPVSTPFTYYGTRKIQLVMEGFETLTVKRTFSPPWYQWPVVDFISENMIR